MFQIPFCLDEFDLTLFYAFQKLGNPIWSPRNNRLHPLNEYIEEHSQEKLSTSDTSSLVTNIGHSHFSTTCDLISGHVIMYVLYMVAAQAIYNLALCFWGIHSPVDSGDALQNQSFKVQRTSLSQKLTTVNMPDSGARSQQLFLRIFPVL